MAEKVTKNSNERRTLSTTREGFAQAVAEQGITFRRSGSGLLVCFPDNKYSPYVPITETQVSRLLATLTSRYRDEDDPEKDWWVSLERIRVWAIDLAQRAPSAPVLKAHRY